MVSAVTVGMVSEYILSGAVLRVALHDGCSSFVAPTVVSAVIGATSGVTPSLVKHASEVPEAVAQLGSSGKSIRRSPSLSCASLHAGQPAPPGQLSASSLSLVVAQPGSFG